MSLTVKTREQAARLISSLDEDGLLELRAMIDEALEQPEEEQPAASLDNNGKGKESRARGWVELKSIGGYGPYAYRRWREGKRLRSEYIGKVKQGGDS